MSEIAYNIEVKKEKLRNITKKNRWKWERHLKFTRRKESSLKKWKAEISKRWEKSRFLNQITDEKKNKRRKRKE